MPKLSSLYHVVFDSSDFYFLELKKTFKNILESQYSFQFPIQLRAIQITQTSFAKHDYKNFLHYILVARNRAKHGEIHGVCWSTEGLSQG